jgi:molybdopterin synthase sulfur carrier subunit
MKVRLRGLARFQEIIGDGIVAGVVESTTITTLLRDRIAAIPESATLFFEPDGTLKKHIIVMRNGSRILPEDAASAPLSDGDEVVVFPPVAGG